MAYYMAQNRQMTNGKWEAVCEVHGRIGTYDDQDDAIDGASGHDSDIHNYDGEDGWDDDEDSR